MMFMPHREYRLEMSFGGIFKFNAIRFVTINPLAYYMQNNIYITIKLQVFNAKSHTYGVSTVVLY